MSASIYKVYHSVSGETFGYKGTKTFDSESECKAFADRCKKLGWNYEVWRFGAFAQAWLLDASWLKPKRLD